MNGNGIARTIANGNGNGHPLRKISLTFFSRLFNIAPSQWPRVSECWFITFFFKIGAAVGWTILTAAFVAQFGISFLPSLFVVNAVLIMASTFFFERFIMRVKREILMILMLIVAGILVFFASVVYDRSPLAFFALAISAESIFLAQFNVFIPILVGDRFTPLESQRTFPFIESSESIGGMIGGALVGLFAERVGVPWFLYLWVASLACVVFVFIIASSFRIRLPPLPFRVSSSVRSERTTSQMKPIFQSIGKIPFLKGLVIIVLLQWLFMNILEFQYTKAIEQTVTKKPESTIAQTSPQWFHAAVLSSPEGVKNLSTTQPNRDARALSTTEQALLMKRLGELKGMFHAGALLIQAIFASHLITGLGIVGSLLLHPIIMLMSLVGMFLKFGFLSSVLAKMNFEITNVIHKNAYFASHYALPKTIRDQAAEFLEGIVRPMGTIVSMLFILGLQLFFSGRDLTMWIHLIMLTIMATILVVTIRLQPAYTKVTRDQLFAHLPYPEHINAIEILAQKGHTHAPLILVEKLNTIPPGSSTESRMIRMKLISALGQSHDYNALPEILEALKDPDTDVRLEAAYALMNFRDIGTQFYTQAFSRFRMIETLKEVFRKENSASVRNAIIKVFSLIHQPDTVGFLLDVLRDSPGDTRAHCIYTLGLFHDPVAAYYILPFLSDPNPMVRANALCALWQFSKYRPTLETQLKEMLESKDNEVRKAGIFAAGELGLPWKRSFAEALNDEDPAVRFEAACALTKCADAKGLDILLGYLLSCSEDEFSHLRRFFTRLKPKAKKMADMMLLHTISEKLNFLMQKYGETGLNEIDAQDLEELKRLYLLAHHHEELYTIENALRKQRY